MGKVLMSGGGGGGVSSDELTATLANVLKGKTVVAKDTGDEIGTGTMPDNAAVSPDALDAGDSYTIPAGYHNGSGKVTVKSLATMTASGDATAAQILAGKKAYVDGSLITGTMPDQAAKTAALDCGGSYTIPAGYHNGSGKVTANSLASQTDGTATADYIRSGYTAWVKGSKLTGTMAVTSAISFSAAARSSTSIRISWTNPSKGPWSGVRIRYSTSGYPGVSGGTLVYTGTGSSTTAGGSSYVDITGLSPGTVYYFTCTSYTTGLGDGASYNCSASTKGFLIYSYGYNPYNLVANSCASIEESHLQVTDQTTWMDASWMTYSSLGWIRFLSKDRIPLATLDGYTKIGVTLNTGSVTSATGHYLAFGFHFVSDYYGGKYGGGASQAATVMLDDREITDSIRTFTISMTNRYWYPDKYASWYTEYDGAVYFRIQCFVSEQEGEDYEEYKTRKMEIYKIWLE